jgi:hypothetical protein
LIIDPEFMIELPEPEQPKTDTNNSEVWSIDEDDVLLTVTEEFQNNWDLISDMVNSVSYSTNGRTPEECAARYDALHSSEDLEDVRIDDIKETPFVTPPNQDVEMFEPSDETLQSPIVITPTLASPTIILPPKTDMRIRRDASVRKKLLKQEYRKRQGRMLAAFEAIKKVVTKHRPQPKNGKYESLEVIVAAALRVSLVAHPSHDAAVKKVVMAGNKLATPSELAMKKMQRARQYAESQHGLLMRTASGPPQPGAKPAPQNVPNNASRPAPTPGSTQPMQNRPNPAPSPGGATPAGVPQMPTKEQQAATYLHHRNALLARGAALGTYMPIAGQLVQGKIENIE